MERGSALRFATAAACLAVLLSWFVTYPALASSHNTASAGMRIVETEQSFELLLQNLRQAISANKMGLVAQASASRGAASRGISIPGNAVLMIFRNDYAVRMLAASVAAGIEAPLRIYVTENEDAKATVSYRLPSEVFAPYRNPKLDEMALELDKIFEKIVKHATSG